MKSHLKFSVLVVSCCLLMPAASAAHRALADLCENAQAQTAQLQSVSGRITSVQGNTFTLEPPRSAKSAARPSQQNAQNVMTFTIDQSTTVEGKIQVGANADVTYRQQDGNDIAVSVRVSAPQSRSLSKR